MSSNIAKSARFLSLAGLLVTTLLIPFNIVNIVKASVTPYSEPLLEDYTSVSSMLDCVFSICSVLVVVDVRNIVADCRRKHQ